MTHEQQVLEDISSAINLWLGISTRNNCSPDDKCSMVSESIMLLLYNAIDLLSIKVCLLTSWVLHYFLFVEKHERIIQFGVLTWYYS